jgi:micrococcal nuclease
MRKRLLSSVILILIAIAIAAYQGVTARPAEPVESGSPDVEAPNAEAEEPSEASEQRDNGAMESASGGPSAAERENTNALVTNVVDGDTMDVLFDDGLEARIRFLGVNTPETVDPRKSAECFGKEASSFTKELLNGERVLLLADAMADERDKYGRLLRNVFLADGTDVNALLVSEGYAHAYLGFPLDPERKAELKRLENDARESGRGLWDPEACADK